MNNELNSATKALDLRNVQVIDRSSDQSVTITFASARAASQFGIELEAMAGRVPAAAVQAARDAATQPQAAMPEGWKLVPVKPTREMLEELTNGYPKKNALMKLRYQQMLNAAPPSPQPVAESVGLKQAADYIDRQAESYLQANSRADYDTGATEWRNDECRDHYYAMTELADEIRNLTSAAALQPVARLTDAAHAARYLWITRTSGLRISLPGQRALKTAEETDAAIDAEIERHLTGKVGASGESN